MPKEPYKIVKRSVKHVFAAEEIAQLNINFRQSFADLKSVEAEFDAVKASYKAKTTEAESKMETLNATEAALAWKALGLQIEDLGKKDMPKYYDLIRAVRASTIAGKHMRAEDKTV